MSIINSLLAEMDQEARAYGVQVVDVRIRASISTGRRTRSR